MNHSNTTPMRIAKRTSLRIPMRVTVVSVLFAWCASTTLVAADKDEPVYRATVTGKVQGVESIILRSPFQPGKPGLHILKPDRPADMPQRLLFVLPVEAMDGHRWGNGLAHVQKHNLHNKYNLIVVAPTFSQLPWFADHATDEDVRQESYFIKAVLPYVLGRYPTKPERRLLIGFSKSGWGAYSLMLRHADKFAAAAAWDAPLMKAKPDQFGMGPIFATQANFQRYQVSKLLAQADPSFQKRTRLVLTGYDGFRKHHVQAHALMDELKIKHIYKDGPKRKHHWETGWITEAIEALVKLSK
jgi:hypothetical protein